MSEGGLPPEPSDEELTAAVARLMYDDPEAKTNIARLVRFYQQQKVLLGRKDDPNFVAAGTVKEIGVNREIPDHLVRLGLLRASENARGVVTYWINAHAHDIMLAALHYASQGVVPTPSTCPAEAPVRLGDFCAPNDLFDIIVGHEKAKYLLNEALTSPHPFHVLMIGPPATAKSLFLEEITRVKYHTPSGWVSPKLIVMGNATKAGIRDILIDRVPPVTPSILLIDELDKVRNAQDYTVLLSVMDPGVLEITQHGMKVERRVKVWVIAAANRIDGIPMELLNRFVKIGFKEYTVDEERAIIENMLVKRRSCSPDVAKKIAEVAAANRLEIREAIQLASKCDPALFEQLVNTVKEMDWRQAAHLSTRLI